MPTPMRVFLLSPARLSGVRGVRILEGRGGAPFLPELDRGGSAPLGEVHAFISSLYFRGKRAYAHRFGVAPPGAASGLVITPDRGLMPLEAPVDRRTLREMAGVDIDPDDPRYREPLLADAVALRRRLGPDGRVILLGSLATGKYLDLLETAFGRHLLVPEAFGGEGDMRRGSRMLRAVASGVELTYVEAITLRRG